MAELRLTGDEARAIVRAAHPGGSDHPRGVDYVRATLEYLNRRASASRGQVPGFPNLQPDGGYPGCDVCACKPGTCQINAMHDTPPADNARDAALDEAATAVEQHDRKGREWVPGSLWDQLTREAAGRIRALRTRKEQA